MAASIPQFHQGIPPTDLVMDHVFQLAKQYYIAKKSLFLTSNYANREIRSLMLYEETNQGTFKLMYMLINDRTFNPFHWKIKIIDLKLQSLIQLADLRYGSLSELCIIIVHIFHWVGQWFRHPLILDRNKSSDSQFKATSNACTAARARV